MVLLKLIALVRALQKGALLGDLVVLKLDALSHHSASLTQRLARVRGYAPTQDVARLRALPAGSFGREYARFLDANRITPLEISPDVEARFRDDPYVLRYTTTHDLHHVLAGFDAGLAGEIGVLAFNVGQGSAPFGSKLLWLACAFYTSLSPTQAGRIWKNARVGLALGNRAELVIADRIESRFEEPLDDVRKKLKISDPVTAGALPSGTSVLVKFLYPKLVRGPRHGLEGATA